MPKSQSHTYIPTHTDSEIVTRCRIAHFIKFIVHYFKVTVHTIQKFVMLSKRSLQISRYSWKCQSSLTKTGMCLCVCVSARVAFWPRILCIFFTLANRFLLRSRSKSARNDRSAYVFIYFIAINKENRLHYMSNADISFACNNRKREITN